MSEQETVIVDGGDPAAEVGWWATGETPTPTPAFAAAELAEYTAAIGGAKPAIAETEPVDCEVPSAVVVAVADADGPSGDRVASATDPLAGAPEDSYVVDGEGVGVVLAGTTHRGTLYAVYELLERLGVRFFAPDYEFYEGHHEYVPDRETVAAPALAVHERPDMTYRRKDVAEGRSHTVGTLRAMVDWMAKVRLNTLAAPADFSNLGLGVVTWDRWNDALAPELRKRGIRAEVGGHGFDSFLPPGEYAGDHPDWFVEGYNVFDVTEPAAREQYVENVCAYLAERPEIDVFDAWPPDGAEWPPRVIEAYGSTANAYAALVNELVEGIADRGLDVTVEAIAYQSHLAVPDPEYMYDDRVLVDFAAIDRSYEVPIDDPSVAANVEYLDTLREWREAFDGAIAVYEYYRKYSWHSLPVVLLEVIGAEVPRFAAEGADGIGIYSEPADWLAYEPTHLLVAALSWDTDLAVESVRERYLTDRYGPVAGRMADYLAAVEEAGRALFDSFSGAYDDEESVTAALAAYRRARDAVEAALDAADDEAAVHLLEALLANAEFAVADTEISRHELAGDVVAAQRARDRAASLLEDHYLDGVMLYSEHILQRCVGRTDRSRAEYIETYREAW